MGRMSREKGKLGEREVAAVLRARGYSGARRGVQFSGGPGSPDVVGVPGLHLEVKRTEQLSLYAALGQSKTEAGAGEVPVVVHRKNAGRWVAILDFEALMDLWEQAHGKPEASNG